MSGPAGESDEWRDDELIVWSMAQTQNNRIWFEDPNKHPDMSTWTLWFSGKARFCSYLGIGFELIR